MTVVFIQNMHVHTIFVNPQSEVYKQTIHPCGSDMSLEWMGVISDQVGVATAWMV